MKIIFSVATGMCCLLLLFCCAQQPAPKSAATSEAAAAPNAQTLWVNHFRAPCYGADAPQWCYSVQMGEQALPEAWTFWSDRIEGFEDQYEWGYVYRLKVAKDSSAAAPADASTVHYRLLEVSEKKPFPKDSTFKMLLKWAGQPSFLAAKDNYYLLLDKIAVKPVNAQVAKQLQAALNSERAVLGTLQHETPGKSVVLLEVKEKD